MPGFELGSLCALVYALRDCFDCNYPSMTWGTWLVAASLIAAPFWFNPLGFSLPKVREDFRALQEVGNWTRPLSDARLNWIPHPCDLNLCHCDFYLNLNLEPVAQWRG